MLLHKKTGAELEFEWPALKYFSGSVEMYPAPPCCRKPLAMARFKIRKEEAPEKAFPGGGQTIYEPQ